jgi:hypothetical protein
MTWAEFAPVFATLAFQLRATDADEAIGRSYFKVLGDLDLELVVMAADEFAATSEWFPKTGEWRTRVKVIEARRQDDLRARLKKLPTPLCVECRDTGWAPIGDRVRPCECRKLRRLEVLGVRPMPLLPEPMPEPLHPEAQAVAEQAARRFAKVMPPVPRAIE